MDPQNWYWNYLLNKMLRFQRRQEFVNSYFETAMPDKAEFDAILNAVELTKPGKNHSMATSGLCAALADILRFRQMRGIRNLPVDIRTDVLMTNASILDFILNQVG